MNSDIIITHYTATDEDGRLTWQVEQDQAVIETVRELIESLISIGPAVSLSELEMTLAKLREERRYAFSDALLDALTALEDEVQFYHGKFMHGGFSHEAMADDLNACLEDL